MGATGVKAAPKHVGEIDPMSADVCDCTVIASLAQGLQLNFFSNALGLKKNWSKNELNITPVFGRFFRKEITANF